MPVKKKVKIIKKKKTNVSVETESESAQIMEPIVEPVVESLVQEPITEPIVEEPIVEEPITEPVVEEAVVEEPAADPVVEPVIESNKALSNTSKASNTSNTSKASKTKSKTKKANEFRLFDFREKNVWKVNAIKYTIIMYGINEKGETCQIEVADYQPFFFVKVPSNFTNKTMSEFIQKIKKETKNIPIDGKIVEMNQLYGFTAGKKSKFVKLTFDNMQAFNRVRQLWGTSKFYKASENFDTTKYQLYESGIPPLLRFFHVKTISPSGWIKVNCDPVKESTTSACTHVFQCSHKNIVPLPKKETATPFKICSFDIEASSSHGDFPLPLKSYKKLAMNMVDIFNLQGQCGISPDNAKKLFYRIIYAGFGLKKFEGVDLVYPKEKVSQAIINNILDTYLQEDITQIKSTKWDVRKEYMVKNAEKFTNDDDDKEHGGGEYAPQNEIFKDKTKSESVTKKVKKGTMLEYLLDTSKSRDDKIIALDIALTSIFPDLKGDEVTFIGSTFLRYGEKEPYKNHCLVNGTCNDVPGAEIEIASSERDLLKKWTQMICNEDPDIIIGYNIFGFDYEFMFRRAQETQCTMDFLRLARSQTLHEELNIPFRDVCGKIDSNGVLDFDAIENKQLVIASGEYDLKFYDIPGRLQIDMYAYFRRDFNLSSYKLDDVASSYISDSIKHVNNLIDENGNEICELYSSNLAGLHKDDYIRIELVTFTVDYYKDGQKFIVKDIVQKEFKGKTYNVIVIDGNHHFEENKKIKWGVAKDDVTPQDIFKLTNGDASDRAKVAKYCIQDCNLVHHLMTKIDVITGYVEMSNICSVPISFLVFRGQGIKLTSYVAKKCREKNTLMPDLEKKTSDSGYEGAIVLPPKCSMYMDNPVACVDYSSLYPSSMISQNYSHDSKVWTKTYDLEGELVEQTGEMDSSGNYIYDNLPGYEYINIDFDVYD